MPGHNCSWGKDLYWLLIPKKAEVVQQTIIMVSGRTLLKSQESHEWAMEHRAHPLLPPPHFHTCSWRDELTDWLKPSSAVAKHLSSSELKMSSLSLSAGEGITQRETEWYLPKRVSVLKDWSWNANLWAIHLFFCFPSRRLSVSSPYP